MTTRKAGNGAQRTPHFIIAGAMKCGTTTVHKLLDLHPDVFLPRGELKVFASDDCSLLPELVFHDFQSYQAIDFDYSREKILRWYSEQYAGVSASSILGEDSPLYLASNLAPKRIAENCPNVKLVFMLRDPVSRAYSHYWHLVRKGRAEYSFETQLKANPGSIIERGCYASQIKRFYDWIPRDSIKILLFEDLVKDVPGVLSSICDFIGVSTIEFPQESFNKTEYPRFKNIAYFRNWCLRRNVWNRHMTSFLQKRGPRVNVFARAADRLHTVMNFGRRAKAPEMRVEVVKFLAEYYYKENQELPSLIDKDLSKYWGSWRLLGEVD